MLDLDEFRRLIRQALVAFSRLGVLHDDIKLDNFYLTDGRVMVVDLKIISNENQQPLTDEELKFYINGAVDSLAKSYEDNQGCFWEDGILCECRVNHTAYTAAIKPICCDAVWISLEDLQEWVKSMMPTPRLAWTDFPSKSWRR